MILPTSLHREMTQSGSPRRPPSPSGGSAPQTGGLGWRGVSGLSRAPEGKQKPLLLTPRLVCQDPSEQPWQNRWRRQSSPQAFMGRSTTYNRVHHATAAGAALTSSSAGRCSIMNLGGVFSRRATCLKIGISAAECEPVQESRTWLASQEENFESPKP